MGNLPLMSMCVKQRSELDPDVQLSADDNSVNQHVNVTPIGGGWNREDFSEEEFQFHLANQVLLDARREVLQEQVRDQGAEDALDSSRISDDENSVNRQVNRIPCGGGWYVDQFTEEELQEQIAIAAERNARRAAEQLQVGQEQVRDQAHDDDVLHEEEDDQLHEDGGVEEIQVLQEDEAHLPEEQVPYVFHYNCRLRTLLLCVAFMIQAHDDLKTAIILQNNGTSTPQSIVFFVHAMAEKVLTAIKKSVTNGWAGIHKGNHCLMDLVGFVEFRFLEDGDEICSLMTEACKKIESVGGFDQYKSVCIKSRYPNTDHRDSEPWHSIPGLVFQGADIDDLISTARSMLSKGSEVINRFVEHSLPLLIPDTNLWLTIGNGFNGKYTMKLVPMRELTMDLLITDNQFIQTD